MYGYVTCKTITEAFATRHTGRWYRITKSWSIGLRATKGWKKLGPIKTREEWVDRVSLPKGWTRGYSCTVTNSR